MEKIVKYAADVDGKEFHTITACVEYEGQCEAIKEIMSPLAEKPSDCDFSNGSGFLQHDTEIVKQVKVEILTFANELCPHHWLVQTRDEPNKIDPSWAGRILSECGHTPLSNAWHRFSCMDRDGREWGQPYFVLHPDKADQICLNAKV